MLPLRELLQIVAASNFKQPTRMAILYNHAEANNFAVIGTANKNEHDQGFFVKYGDGGVDLLPMVHLFKTQIYQLADYLGVPKEIRSRTPTTDTYSAPSAQQEPCSVSDHGSALVCARAKRTRWRGGPGDGSH